MELKIIIYFITSYPSNPSPLISSYLEALYIGGPFGWATKNLTPHCPHRKNHEISNLIICIAFTPNLDSKVFC